MNVSLSIKTSLWPSVKRIVLHRELRIFLVHLFVWLAIGFLQYYVTLATVPKEQAQPGTSVIYRYADNPLGYLWFELITTTIFLLIVHGCYSVYQWIFRRDSLWNIPAFVVFSVIIFLFFSVLTGFYMGYLHEDFDKGLLFGAIVFSWAYTMVFSFIRAYRQTKRNQRLLQQQKTEAELAALKAQVNPHFLFNTLNNLYGTALAGDSNRTAAGIEQLSSVMRHMVEEAKHDRTPIRKEIGFLEDTVDLHRMRLPQQDNIRVRSVMDWDGQPTPDGRPVEIAPLLLVSFIENAFKYGISINQDCFVDIQLTVERGRLSFQCRNSIVANNRLASSTGTGINNVRQRLQLIYPSRHQLTLRNEAGVFDIALTIDL